MKNKHLTFRSTQDVELIKFCIQELEKINISKSVLLNSDIHINGYFVHHKKWETTSLKAGDVVEIYPNIHVTAIAGAIAATIFGAGLAATVATYVFSAIIGIGFSFALNWGMSKLFPTDKPEVATPAQTEALATITGANNQYRPGEPLPVVIGEMRTTPDLALPYYSVISNGNLEIRHLFCVSAGDVEVWDVRRDNTSINSLYGIEIYAHKAWRGEPLVWFNPAITASQEDFLTDDYAVFQAESPINAKKLTFILTFPNGLKGTHLTNLSLRITAIFVQVSLVRQADGYTVEQTHQVYNPTPQKTTYRHAIEIDLPSVGEWSVFIHTYWFHHMTTNDKPYGDATYSISNRISEVQWERDEPALVYQGKSMTLIELKATASDRLSGALNTINCMARMLGTDSAGNRVWSSNPALLARRLMTDSDLIDNSEYAVIDNESFDAFEKHCDYYGFEVNAVENTGRKLGEVLSDMLEIGQGYLTGASGRYTIYYDNPAQAYVDVINSRNSWGMSITSTKPIKAVDQILVRFYNKDKDYQEDERKIPDNIIAKNPQVLSNKFITNADLAYKYGMLNLVLQQRNKIYKFNTDWRGIDYRLGQKLLLQHPNFFLGIGTAGRVVNYITDQYGSYTGIVLDQEYPVSVGVAYVLARTEKYSSQFWDIKAIDNITSSTLYLTVPIIASQTSILPRLGEILVFGETGKVGVEVLIKNIVRNSNYTAEIECAPSDDSFYLATQGIIPPFESALTFPSWWEKAKPNTPLIYGVSIKRETASKDALHRIIAFANINLNYQEKQDVEFGYYRIGIKLVTDSEYEFYTSTDKYSFAFEVIQTLKYNITVTCYGANGLASDATTITYDPIELMEPLTEPPRFTIIYDNKGHKSLIWQGITDWRPFTYEIRRSVSSGSYGSSLLVGSYDEPSEISVSQLGVYYLTAKSGYASSTTRLLEIESVNGSSLVPNVIQSYNERLDGWQDRNNNIFYVDDDELILFPTNQGAYESDDAYNIPNVYYAGYTTGEGTYYLGEDKTITLDADTYCYISLEYGYYLQSIAGDAYNDINAYYNPNAYGIVGGDMLFYAEIMIRVNGVWASEWVEFKTGNYLGDGFKFRFRAKVDDTSTLLHITDYIVIVDVPDKMFSLVDSIPATGKQINFAPPFNMDNPAIEVTLYNTDIGESHYIDRATVNRHGFFVQIRNQNGIGVARDINILAQGY